MRPLPILIGLLVLTMGMAIYFSIPNTHSTQTTSTRNFAGPKQEIIPGGSVLTHPLNITLYEDGNTTLVVYLTVTASASQGLSQLDFRISNAPNRNSCILGEPPSGCIYEKTVSNATLEIPLHTSGSYYFVLDNSASSQEKLISYTVSLKRDLTSKHVTLDGPSNWLGVGLGAVGTLAVFYGLTRKTVIPWE